MKFKKFHEAKQRLKNFLLSTDMSDDEERQRLLNYFSHRYVTLIAILKEAIRSRRLMKMTGGNGRGHSASLPVLPQRRNEVNTELSNPARYFNGDEIPKGMADLN